MKKFILIGLEFNNIWKLPDFYVGEDDGILITAKDYLSEAALFSLEEAELKQKYLQDNYNDYTWYIMITNDE